MEKILKEVNLIEWEKVIDRITEIKNRKTKSISLNEHLKWLKQRNSHS
ncbi:MAG: hypothetical protein IPI78_18750 [Chitinophagaceae bacterium]|nr:hypothetical protein [Chitinophagaceae bacterium]